MREQYYNRQNAINYAKQWAYGRNPKYYNYDSLGGDCTNFISQCIFAGSKVMNYDKQNGWYYINANNKSPSWTGVEFLYNFLCNNKSVGPYGKKCIQNNIQIGDVVQLSVDGMSYQHSLVIVKIINTDNMNDIYTASHTFDSYERKISSYSFKSVRFIHIEGVRNW